MRKLMMLSLLVAGLSVGFAPLSAGAQAPTGKASIKGKVVGADGKPAAGVAVRLMHKEDKAATHKGAEPKTTAPAAKGKAAKGKGAAAANPKPEAVAETTADAKGEFSFAGVAPGKYVVAARQKGVGNGREQVTVSGDGASNVTVKLKAEKGKGKAADSQARANHKHVKKAAVS